MKHVYKLGYIPVLDKSDKCFLSLVYTRNKKEVTYNRESALSHTLSQILPAQPTVNVARLH
jgi:hypothetical protein